MLLVFGIDLSKDGGFEKLKAYIERADSGEEIAAMLKEIDTEIGYALRTGKVRNKIVLETVLELVHNYAVSRGL